MSFMASSAPTPAERNYTPGITRAEDRQLRRQRARQRAYRRLAALHPEEFKRLLADELRGVWGGAS